jgi:hypothetical protein
MTTTTTEIAQDRPTLALQSPVDALGTKRAS